MQNGDDAHGVAVNLVENGVGKATDQHATQAAMKWWKQCGLIGNAGERGVDHPNEIFAQARQTLLIPVVRSEQIGDGR